MADYKKSEKLSGSGSNRVYSRVWDEEGRQFIRVEGTSAQENKAFITLARHFYSKGIPVPAVLSVSDDGMSYVQEDLGDTLLYDYAGKRTDLLCKSVALLPKIQFEGAQGLDFSVCYPQPEFDRRMVRFDLNYFKYCYLKTTGKDFQEVLLEDEFDKLCEDLISLKGNSDTFMYRDFQARNVMIKEDELYFIDFQGGRKGPIYYDMASFVWQAKADYPEEVKQKMIDAYLAALSEYMVISKEEYLSNLRIFVLFRTLQVLGAYGFRGLYEKKKHFIESIPFALANLRSLLGEDPVLGDGKELWQRYPYLCEVLSSISSEHPSSEVVMPSESQLIVTIYSFSFKKGIPADDSGNGGGYVFDCRSIHNPGRYDEYKQLTGMDQPVIKFLEDDGEITRFLNHVYGVVEPHVETFISRGFTSLQVCFGCTGGQHRSVYCAESLAERLASRYPVKVRLIHREQGRSKEL